MVRIAGSWVGVSLAFKAVADHYGWTHIVVVSDDKISTCWYGAKPFEATFGANRNYSFAWLRLGPQPSDDELDDVLQQIRALTRGVC